MESVAEAGREVRMDRWTGGPVGRNNRYKTLMNTIESLNELFGAGVQDLWYGLENGRFAFRAFDVAVDGRYVDFDVKLVLFERFGIECVPILFRGPFSRTAVEEHVGGPTTMCPLEKAGKFKGREGIVMTPTTERSGEAAEHQFSRVILKAISFEYLERKGGTEYH